MNIEELRDFCLQLNGVTEELPFGPETLVFKVAGKIFLLTPLDSDTVRFNIKCDPEKAIELRERYSFVVPGYHMSKKHWNTVTVTTGSPDQLLKDWIKDSYDLVIKSLPKSMRDSLSTSP